MDPILSAEIESLRDRFAALTPAFSARAQGHDETAQFPQKNFDDVRAAGLLGLLLPQSIGGLGQSYLSFAPAIAEVARGCPSTGLCLTMHYAATSVLLSASSQQVSRFGSEVVQQGK